MTRRTGAKEQAASPEPLRGRFRDTDLVEELEAERRSDRDRDRRR